MISSKKINFQWSRAKHNAKWNSCDAPYQWRNMMREVFYAYTVQGKTYDNLNIMS